ncbi:MAG TPA: FKBP-type peptidyl-prolyl cis-trans isomerase [Chitinophagaceae bacterium]|nr:FKBP-type peptidyl-prolyl cis-trans isomerase [Chitinophagaceae bacterium]
MKKIVLLSLLGSFLIMNESCIKNEVCKDKSVDSEKATIAGYAAANGISGTEHSSGVYYQVMNPGSGATPTASSTITVKYTGKLLSGTIFDAQTSTPVSVNLGQVIQGWKIGLPLIQKGGTIKLIIPSSLGYGCNGFGTVPANSILYFEIELVDVH